MNTASAFPFFRLVTVSALAILLALSGCARSKANSNLDPKSSSDPAAGGYVWGQNDKDGKPDISEKSDDVIAIQREVLKRQEIEKERLEREKQDILRQQHYNLQLQKVQ